MAKGTVHEVCIDVGWERPTSVIEQNLGLNIWHHVAIPVHTGWLISDVLSSTVGFSKGHFINNVELFQWVLFPVR